LFLTSDRPGSLGVTDLWVSTRASTSDPWSTPANMGPIINGPGNQSGATFSFDGLTLYFNAARNSRPGFGNFDLFVTTRSRARESDQDD
jgi:hypothetical protein